VANYLADVQQLKPGLIIFRRGDVQHRNWYCRVKVPSANRYKTISLKTSDINEAKDKAFDHDADIRFRVRHQVPVFDKSFAEVAKEYSDFQKRVAEIGQITMKRWQTVEQHIRLHLIPYMGNIQITSVAQDKWTEYPFWRKQNNAPKAPKKAHPLHKRPKAGATPQIQDKEAEAKEKKPEPAKNGTIRQEMTTFRAVMKYAADKHYIREQQVPKGDLPEDKNRREEFTLQEYRHLHTFARTWIKNAKTKSATWSRTMAYNFMLIMANTGMRTMEASNLRWRDIDVRSDKLGRTFAALNVRGKGKFRELVAAQNVVEYLERIREISKATKPDDFVFSTAQGKRPIDLYEHLIGDLLEKSQLLFSSSGSRRSTYCFRHTYATFRLMEGVDVYFLAKQMGTSVKMIEDYYGHITPAKNAERILQGVPGWEPIAEPSGNRSDSMNADGAGEGPPHDPPTNRK
jgi:integrase